MGSLQLWTCSTLSGRSAAPSLQTVFTVCEDHPIPPGSIYDIIVCILLVQGCILKSWIMEAHQIVKAYMQVKMTDSIHCG